MDRLRQTPGQMNVGPSASMLRRALLVLAVAGGIGHTAGGQGTSTAIARTLFGDVALELRSERTGTLLIGAAGPTNTLTLDVRATDARRWADSASRLLSGRRNRALRAGAKSGAIVVRARAVLEEPGVGAGSLVLARSDSAGARTWLLFISGADFDGVRQSLDAAEAATLIKLLRRAAVIASHPAGAIVSSRSGANGTKPKSKASLKPRAKTSLKPKGKAELKPKSKADLTLPEPPGYRARPAPVSAWRNCTRASSAS